MARLLTLKTGVAELEGLGFSALEERDEEGSDEDDESELDPEELDAMMARLGVDKNQLARMQQIGGGMSMRGVIELLMDAATEDEDDEELEVAPKHPTPRVGKDHSAPKPTNGGASSPTTNGKSKKKSEKAKLSNGKVEPVYDLVEPAFESSAKRPKAQTSSSSAPTPADSLDFSEPTALEEADAADKTARTKALQFHTSKIAKKSGKQQKERRAMGGDDDIPYADSRRKGKEVKKQTSDDAENSEHANLIPLVEGKRRVWGEAKAATEETDEWGGLQSADKGKKRARDVDADSEGDETTTEYLELVKSTKKRKKEEKQAAYEAKEEEKRCVEFKSAFLCDKC